MPQGCHKTRALLARMAFCMFGKARPGRRAILAPPAVPRPAAGPGSPARLRVLASPKTRRPACAPVGAGAAVIAS